jgi:4-nitrophenyl phosphatase
MNQWLSAIRGLILDMDGVLWRDNEAQIDMPDFFKKAEDRGLQVVLATNNATRSVAQYQEKLRGFGVELRPAQIVNSAMAVCYYLQLKYPQGGPVYIVGEDGLRTTLSESGFIHTEENVLAVVASIDHHLSYGKLSHASRLIRDGAEFIGTNPDRTFPTPAGLTPGSGAVLAFLEAASGVKPHIAGKPEAFMFDLALKRMGLERTQVLTVGDRLETDILGGQRAGCRTAAVLTGVSTLVEINAWKPAVDLVLENLAQLIPLMDNVVNRDKTLP